jgi:hypothetical protein
MRPALRDVSVFSEGADAIERLLDGTLSCIVVREVWPASDLARVVDYLESGQLDVPLHRRDHPEPEAPQVGVYGMPISPSRVCRQGPDPSAYRAQADMLASRLGRLFEHTAPFLRTFEALVARAGATARRAEGYGACTIRRVPERCDMVRHCENLYADIEVLAPLRQRVRIYDTCSFFLTLRGPPKGGDLVVFETPWDDPRGETKDQEEELVVRTRPGDVVLLAAGRQYHRVTTAEGGPRWTIGGFFAPRSDGQGIEYWG